MVQVPILESASCVRLFATLMVVCTALLSACTPASAGADCAVEVDGRTVGFDHVYALRAHDPYDMDDSTRLTRVVCFEKAVPEGTFRDESSFIDFVMGRPGAMAIVDVRDNGEVVAAGYAIDGGPVIANGPFGGFTDLVFAGSNGPTKMVGTVTTKSALETPGDPDRKFSVTVQVDRAFDATW